MEGFLDYAFASLEMTDDHPLSCRPKWRHPFHKNYEFINNYC